MGKLRAIDLHLNLHELGPLATADHHVIQTVKEIVLAL